MHRSEDSRSVVGDVDVFVLWACGDGHKDFVHASGAEGGLDEIGDSDGSDEGGLYRDRGTSLAIYPFSSLAPSLMTWGRTF